MFNSLGYDFMVSWLSHEGIHSTDYLLKWINEQNKTLEVRIDKIALEESPFWFYEKGIQHYQQNLLIDEKPIIQPEIGLLGILCKKINGIIHFLMQAKIEPGNINKVQISPTIQATKSNFTQQHGGNKPDFLEYFYTPKKPDNCGSNTI